MSLIASCHCGGTKIELPDTPTHAKECNCSFCFRTGAIWAYYPADALKLLSTESQGMYSQSGMNLHYLCSRCGMQTWGDSPDWASMYNADGTPKEGDGNEDGNKDGNGMPTQRIHAVNLRLVDGLDLSAVTIEQMDGRNNW